MKEFSFSDEKIKEKAELMLQEQNQKHRNDLEAQPWHLKLSSCASSATPEAWSHSQQSATNSWCTWERMKCSAHAATASVVVQPSSRDMRSARAPSKFCWKRYDILGFHFQHSS
jgi:hypothetical protein